MVFGKIKKKKKTARAPRAAARPALPSPPWSQRCWDSSAPPRLALGTQHLWHDCGEPGGLQGTAFGGGDQQADTARSRKPCCFGKPSDNGSLLFFFFHSPPSPRTQQLWVGRSQLLPKGMAVPAGWGQGPAALPPSHQLQAAGSCSWGAGTVMNTCRTDASTSRDNRDPRCRCGQQRFWS